jgi:hypothetical protein
MDKNCEYTHSAVFAIHFVNYFLVSWYLTFILLSILFSATLTKHTASIMQ